MKTLLNNLAQQLAPPAWAVEEVQRRIVLLLNHVLMQEPQAMERLERQKGRRVLVQWRQFSFQVRITPAGLLESVGDASPADLTLTLTQESPLDVAQTLMRGDKPGVRVEGDVQLAAEINWMAEYVRWDVEEDLARIVGDVPAHTLAQAVRQGIAVLRQFVGQRSASSSSAAKAAAPGVAPAPGAPA